MLAPNLSIGPPVRKTSNLFQIHVGTRAADYLAVNKQGSLRSLTPGSRRAWRGLDRIKMTEARLEKQNPAKSEGRA